MSISTVICGSDEFIHIAKAAGAYQQEDLQQFSSGERCRDGLRESRDIRLVLVGPELIDVEPINLIAALRKDRLSLGAEGCRLLLFERGEVSGSLSSRAHTAGANDVVPMSEIAKTLAPVLRPVGTLQSKPQYTAQGVSAISPSAASGTVIIVASGRGGTGKTTISLLSA
ncbi:MAG: hypothetical protein HGA54_09970, partial [Actinobacteria bacterium]|nr:hypothetical protein [Actinomycetota bacterium]